MGKKRERIRRRRRITGRNTVERLLDTVHEQLVATEYEGVIRTCQRILRHEPLQPEQRARAFEHLGVAHLMLQHFDEGYDALSAAVRLRPDGPDLWYDRGLASRLTMRLGQSVRDFEQAVALESDGPGAGKFAEELAVSREMAQREMLLRGPDFTLEQLIVQEELFQQAAKLMTARRWPLAEKAFRRVIEMGDCLPQPWGNLGVCLLVQERFDEAEAALKRALEIDPDYEHARRNLALLPKARMSGLLPQVEVTHPLEGRELSKSIIFRE